jgi:hypothetical protein
LGFAVGSGGSEQAITATTNATLGEYDGQIRRGYCGIRNPPDRANGSARPFSGQITDSSGAVVSQAGVKVTNVETGVVTTTASNDHGDRRVFVGVKVLF